MQKKIFFTFFLGILCFGVSFTANADRGVSFSSGWGAGDIIPIRIGFQKYWPRSWRDDKLINVRGYWEASLYQMFGKQTNEPGSNNSLQAGVIAGSFRFELNENMGDNVWPYLDFGLGASLVSKREISGKELGINYQFEDRVGFGMRFGKNRKYEIGYRFIHFSNAYLGDPNHGLNLHTIVFGYWF